jgi:hypothetical protein
MLHLRSAITIWTKTDTLSQALTTQCSTKKAENDTNGTSVMEANQNTTTINEKKKAYCQQKKTNNL